MGLSVKNDGSIVGINTPEFGRFKEASNSTQYITGNDINTKLINRKISTLSRKIVVDGEEDKICVFDFDNQIIFLNGKESKEEFKIDPNEFNTVLANFCRGIEGDIEIAMDDGNKMICEVTHKNVFVARDQDVEGRRYFVKDFGKDYYHNLDAKNTTNKVENNKIEKEDIDNKYQNNHNSKSNNMRDRDSWATKVLSNNVDCKPNNFVDKIVHDRNKSGINYRQP